jgi:hypothetical protein
VVLGLGPGTRDNAPLTPRPPPFRVEEAARGDATRFGTSPRPVLLAPLAGLPLEPHVPDSAPGVLCEAPSGASPKPASIPQRRDNCIAVDRHLLSGAA